MHILRIGPALLLIGLLAVVTSAQQPSTLTPTLVLKGHTEAIYSTGINKDGTLGVTGSFDKSVRLWDLKTGKQFREFSGPNGHQSLVLSVAFTPLGDQIASGGSDNTAKVWDVPLSTPVRELLHAAAVTAVALSPDGKTIAGTSRDGTVQLWSAADGKPLAKLPGHPGGATSVAFSANNLTVATSGVDGTIRFWNVADGKAIGTIGGHAGPVTGIALSPNGNALYSIGEDAAIKYWQLPAPIPKPLTAHAAEITSLTLSADSGLVVTGGADKSVKVSNSASGQIVREMTGVAGKVLATNVSPNGALVLAGAEDGKAYVWSQDGKTVATVAAHTGGVTGVAANASGNGLITAGVDGVLRSWAFPIAASKSIALPDRALGTSLSPDGKRLVIAGADKLVRTFAYPAGTPERQFTGHTGPVTAAGLTPDGTTLVSASLDETIRIWSTANGTQASALAGHVGPIHSLVVAPNGTFVVSGGEDGTVKIWGLPVVAPKSLIHPDAVTSFVLSADGNRAITFCADKQVRVWNLANPAPERTFNVGGVVANAASFAPDGTVALALADKSISLRSGDKELKKIPVPAEPKSVVYSPGGQLWVGGADNTIRVFNPADSKELKALTGHTGAIPSLIAGPKGDMIYSMGLDRTVRSWGAVDHAAKGKIDLPMIPTGIAIAKDGTKLIAGGEKTVVIVSIADGKTTGTIAVPADVRGVTLAVDGNRIAVACADNRVRVYGIDLKLQEMFLHEGPTSAVAFLPDGKRLLTASADKSLRTWAPALVAQFTAVGPVRQVLVSAASDKIVAVGDDKLVHVLDAKTGKETKAIPSDLPIIGASAVADCSKLVTISAKAATLWTVADGKAVTTIPVPGVAQAVAVSPSGLKVAMAFADGAIHRVRVYDAVTGRELQSLSESPSPIRSLAFLADNRGLVVAGDDKTAATHDTAATGAILAHPGGVVSFALSPSTPTAITAGTDKTVKAWDLTTGKEKRTITTSPEAIVAMTVSRDFAAIAVVHGTTVRVLQESDSKELAKLVHPAPALSVAFSGDRTRVVTGCADNVARVWDVATGKMLQWFAHAGPVRAVGHHSSQPTVYTASADKTAIIQPLAITRHVSSPAMKPLRSISIAAGGAQLAVAGDDPVVRLINSSSGNEERKFEGAAGPVYSAVYSKNGQLLATGGQDKSIRLYTLNDAKEVGVIAAAAAIRGLAFSTDGKMLVGIADDKTVTAWSTAFQPGQPLPEDFGKPIQQFAHADAVSGVVIGEKGEVLTASVDKTIRQWKVASNVATRSFQHPNLVDGVDWSPDGKLLATACHDGIVRVFDVEKNSATKTINAHTQPQPSPVYSVTWTADGKQLVSTSFDRSIKIWDAASGNLVRELKPFVEKMNEKGHTDQVFCAAVTKDGRLIATGSSDRRLKLWDATSGNVVREFTNPNIKGEAGQSHPGGVYQVRFTPDEKYLVSVGPAPRNKGYLAVWQVADGKLIYAAESNAGPTFGLAVGPTGKLALIGNGPKVRQIAEAEAMVVPLP